MAEIIDGKAIADQIKSELRNDIEKLKAAGTVPGLAGVMVGNDPASAVYVNMKEKACRALGIYFDKVIKPDDFPEKDLLDLIDNLNKADACNWLTRDSVTPRTSAICFIVSSL